MYSYSIDVHRVDRCPEKVSEWQAATERMGCNDGRGYHCVPDKFHESLIEFCYDKLRILVSKGKEKPKSPLIHVSVTACFQRLSLIVYQIARFIRISLKTLRLKIIVLLLLFFFQKYISLLHYKTGIL